MYPVPGTVLWRESVSTVTQSVSQLFHGPAPRSPLHRLALRLRHSRSNCTVHGPQRHAKSHPRTGHTREPDRGTGPDTQRAQAHRHAGGSRDTQTVPTRAHSSAGSPSGSAAPGLTQGHQEQDVTIRQKDLFVPWLRSIYLSNRDKPGCMDQVFVVWTSKSGLNQMRDGTGFLIVSERTSFPRSEPRKPGAWSIPSFSRLLRRAATTELGARRPRAAARREPRTPRVRGVRPCPNRELWQRSHVFRRNSNASDRPDRSSGSGSSTMTKLECVRSRAQAAEPPPQCRPPGR